MVRLPLTDFHDFAPITHSEADLKQLEAVLEGDAAAEQDFALRYTPLIVDHVRRYSASRSARVTEEDLQDIVGEVWVSLWENDKLRLRRFDPRRGLKVSTWLRLLARNKTVDWLRARSSRPPTAGEQVPPELEASGPLPDNGPERRERAALVARAVARLTPAERRFLEVWYGQERSGEDLARELGISTTTVYTRRFKIVAKLARLCEALERSAAAGS